MAARILSKNTRSLVVYMPSLRFMVKHFRAFSSYDESTHTHLQPNIASPILDSMTEFPDPRLGPIAVSDKHFPMPGLVGASIPVQIDTDASTLQEEPDTASELLTTMLPHERQAAILQQYLALSREITDEDLDEILEESVADNEYAKIECQAISCPDLIRKDFQELFPFRDVQNGPLTVITVCQKTKNDMTGWNPDVEEEREHLLEQFVTGCEEICQTFQASGFWADFIDPSSGRPYLGDYTNATMFETDERYRHFGFEITDLGCCKVINHHLWGTHSYIGCLFTNAPVDHPLIENMLKKRVWDESSDE